MKITRKTELIIERERRVTIKLNDAAGERFCPSCGENSQFVTIDEAAIVRQTTVRQVFRLIENGQFHFVETENGALFVCLKNLSADGADILRSRPA